MLTAVNPLRILSRSYHLFRRRMRARKLGFQYSRGRDWQIPKKITINGSAEKLFLPQDEGTRVAFGDIFLDDCYGLKKIKFSVKRILDIGAHAGLFSLYARGQFSDAMIHAYEPNGKIKVYLEHQARLGDFTFHMEAIGKEEGRVSLQGGSVQASSRIDRQGEIPMVSLREAIRRMGGEIDLLKLDCEGAEWDIFQDAESFKNVKAISMEYHLTEGHTLKELCSILLGLGYKILHSQEDGYHYGRVWAAK